MKPKSKAEMSYLTNPRPDLTEDATLWARLLLKTYPIDGETNLEGLFWALHGMRCLGAHLRLGNASLLLEPGEMAYDEYMRLRAEYLVHHAAQLKQVLAELAVPAQVERTA